VCPGCSASATASTGRTGQTQAAAWPTEQGSVHFPEVSPCGLKVPKCNLLVLSSHVSVETSGKEETDQSELGIYVCKKPATKFVTGFAARTTDIAIQPGGQTAPGRLRKCSAAGGRDRIRLHDLPAAFSRPTNRLEQLGPDKKGPAFTLLPIAVATRPTYPYRSQGRTGRARCTPSPRGRPASTSALGTIKWSGVYKNALSRAKESPAVQAALGVPITDGFLINGSVKVADGSGSADLSIPLSGPNGSGTLHAVATRSAGKWTFSTLTVGIQGSRERIDLLAGQ
jgi:hypothetical protein